MATLSQEGINFPFPANTPVSTVLVKWSQLGHPGSSGGISSVIGGSSPDQVSSPTPTCNNILHSDTRLQVQYSEESLSATGSSKTLLLQHLQAHSYSEANTRNHPYKTYIQDCFEHCLGTVSSSLQGVASILQFLLLLAYFSSLDARLLQRYYTAIHRCCFDPAVPTSPGLLLLLGRAPPPEILHGYTQVLLRSCSSYFSWPTSPPWTRASSRDTTRLYTGVASILQFLLLLAYFSSLDARLLQRYYTAIHRCCFDPAVPTSPGLLLLLGRAPPPEILHGYTQVLLRSCSSYFSWPTSPPWTRASSRDTTRLYTGVASILQFLLLLAYFSSLDARLLQRYYTAIHRCCFDPAVPTSPGLLLLLGRAPPPEILHGYTQVLLRSCSSYFSWPTSPPWTRASSRDTTRLYTGVASILQFLLLLAYFSSLDARLLQRYYTATQVLLRSCSSYFSWPTSPPWTRASSRDTTQLYTGVASILQFLLLLAYFSSLDARLLQRYYTAIHRCCFDPAVPTSPGLLLLLGRAPPPEILHGYTQVLLRSCSSYFSWPTSPPWTRASSRDTTRLYTGVASILQFLLLLAYFSSLDARLLQRYYTAIHRCCFDPAVPTSPGLLLLLGRAPPPEILHGYTQVLLRSCSSYFSWPTSPPWTRASSRDTTRLYTGVASILQFLLLLAYFSSLDARLLQRYYTAIHRCCFDPAVPTSPGLLLLLGRAPPPEILHGYTQVLLRSCSSYFSWPTSPPWTRASSRDTTRLYTGVASILRYFSWPTSPPWTRASSRDTTRLYTGVASILQFLLLLAYFSSLDARLLLHGYTQVLPSCSPGLVSYTAGRAPSLVDKEVDCKSSQVTSTTRSPPVSKEVTSTTRSSPVSKEPSKHDTCRSSVLHRQTLKMD